MRPWAAFLSLAIVVATLPATAEPELERRANAENLFRQGNALMIAHRYVEACPLLAESQRLEPAGGTLQNLALCYEQIGALANAYAAFDELRSTSRALQPPRTDRIKLAEDRMAALEPRLSRIEIQGVPEDARVTIDGNAYGSAALAAGVLANPGAHVVEASQPGRETYRHTLQVESEGKRTSYRLPPLRTLAAPAPAPGAAPRVTARPPRSRVFEATLLGTGALVAAGGAVFGVLAAQAKSSGEDACRRESNPAAPATDFDPTGRCYDDSSALMQANDDKSDARTYATVATVLIPLGILTVGAAVALLVRRPTASAASGGFQVRF